MSRIAELRERVRVIRTIRIALEYSRGDIQDARVWLASDVARCQQAAEASEARAKALEEEKAAQLRRALPEKTPESSRLRREAARNRADAEISDRARLDLRTRNMSELGEDEDKALKEIGELEATAREMRTKVKQGALL